MVYEDNLDYNVLDEMVYAHATSQGENFKGHWGWVDDLIRDVDYVYVHEVDTCGARGFEAWQASW